MTIAFEGKIVEEVRSVLTFDSGGRLAPPLSVISYRLFGRQAPLAQLPDIASDLKK
jgi:hypothetical protein